MGSTSYAAGDVTNRDAFVYMAAHGAKIAARNALNGDESTYDNRAMPWVVFTDPQVAGVGLTEAAGRAAGHQVNTSTVNLDQVPRALAARDTRGLIKLVVDARTDVLLQCDMTTAAQAGRRRAHECAARRADPGAGRRRRHPDAGTRDQTRHDGDGARRTLFPYLTTVEGLKLAALGFNTDVARLSC